jgi:superfamily II DNA or RNA helicase
MAHSKQNIKQIKLYDYQQIAFDKIVVALKKTFRALMVMATGLGKTIIDMIHYY